MSPDAAAALLEPAVLNAFAERCDLIAPPVLDDFTTTRAEAALADIELLVTSWGCPPLDARALDAAPLLRGIVHMAGSIRGHVTEACWERGIEVSSAAAANALPVAEYTVAMILLAGKAVLERAEDYRRARRPDDWLRTPPNVGNYRKTVGVLSASLVGRRVIELLRPHDFTVLLHDPYVHREEAAALGVRGVGIRELFERSDIVTVHTPLLPATRGLVRRDLLTAMRPNSTLINTARGAVLDQDALTELLKDRRLRAVLDVTDPEALPPEHPLWDYNNVLITPHLAGSQGNEWLRLADLALAEVERWVAGDGFAHPVRRETLEFIA